MPDTYRITVTTKSGETHVGLMNRSQPEMVNGFLALLGKMAHGYTLRLMTCSRLNTCRNNSNPVHEVSTHNLGEAID